MSEFMFSVSRTRVTAKQVRQLQRIAKKHGASFIEVSGPQFGGYQSWFTSRNMGAPFDQQRADAVAADIAAAKIDR